MPLRKNANLEDNHVEDNPTEDSLGVKRKDLSREHGAMARYIYFPCMIGLFHTIDLSLIEDSHRE